MEKNNADRLQRHVTFCAQLNDPVYQSGKEAEFLTVQFLIDNLAMHTVGDYRVLVNYNLPVQTGGASGALELDVVVVDRFGIFAVEVKDWRGTVEAFDGYWLQSQKYRQVDAFASITQKARVLHSCLFSKDGMVRDIRGVSVAGLVVLARGTDNFTNHSRYSDKFVVGIGDSLIRALSSRALLFRGDDSALLSDPEIQKIKDSLFRSRGEAQKMIGNYRILGELSKGDLFDAFEGVNTTIPDRRVRIKRYTLPTITGESQQNIRLFEQNARALAKLGGHQNILQSYDFFPSVDRPDTFYEVTEPIRGDSLDDVMRKRQEPLSLKQQLDYLEPLCEALKHAHARNVIHRNVSPETVFITRDSATGEQIVKLCDFDFAKLVGGGTISKPGEVLVETPYTAPEIFYNPRSATPASDIYSLGVLWFAMASLPHRPSLSPANIDKLALPDQARILIRRMVATVPTERPQAVAHVLEKLRALEKK